jgi:formylglycine-generating enzyme
MRFFVLLLLAGCQGEQVVEAVGDSATTDTTAPADAPPTTGCDSTRGPKMVKVSTFCIDETEVTRAQFREYLAAGDRATHAPPFCTWNIEPVVVPSGGDELPVGDVNFCDAKQFCAWSGKRLCGKIGGGTVSQSKLADPSVSQWFHACSRNGTNTYPYAGGYDESKCATTGPLSAVKSHSECSAAGVYDLNGNVEEWEDACDAPAPGPDTTCRGRGGGNDDGMKCTCAYSDVASARARFAGLGFRCCRDL